MYCDSGGRLPSERGFFFPHGLESGEEDFSVSEASESEVLCEKVDYSCVTTADVIEEFSGKWLEGFQMFGHVGFDPERFTAVLEKVVRATPLCYDPANDFGFIEKLIVPSGTEIFVRADLHGDLKSLLENLKALQKQKVLDDRFRCRNDVLLVFLGDYMDRGGHVLQVAELLALLKVENPENVILIRGNHEYLDFNKQCNAREASNWGDFLAERSNEEAVALLGRFYESMPLTIYIGSETAEGKIRYYQFTHGLFELTADSAHLLDSRSNREKMSVTKERRLSDRLSALQVDLRTDYLALFYAETIETEKERYKTLYCVSRLIRLINSQNDFLSRNVGNSGNRTSYNWGDATDGPTELGLMGARRWKMNHYDICLCLKLASVNNVVAGLFRGHQHKLSRFTHKSTVIWTLPVGMETRAYQNQFRLQEDSAFVLKTDPVNWRKQVLVRKPGTSRTSVVDWTDLECVFN